MAGSVLIREVAFIQCPYRKGNCIRHHKIHKIRSSTPWLLHHATLLEHSTTVTHTTASLQLQNMSCKEFIYIYCGRRWSLIQPPYTHCLIPKSPLVHSITYWVWFSGATHNHKRNDINNCRANEVNSTHPYHYHLSSNPERTSLHRSCTKAISQSKQGKSIWKWHSNCTAMQSLTPKGATTK